MPYNATVLYPATSDSTFNMKYYLDSHMPLAHKSWAPHLKDWKVIEYAAGQDGSKPYSVAAILTFDSAEDMQKALACEATKEVVSPVPHPLPNSLLPPRAMVTRPRVLM
jgi:uncharacterized protein (TIGR02118 family)